MRWSWGRGCTQHLVSRQNYETPCSSPGKVVANPLVALTGSSTRGDHRSIPNRLLSPHDETVLSPLGARKLPSWGKAGEEAPVLLLRG